MELAECSPLVRPAGWHMSTKLRMRSNCRRREECMQHFDVYRESGRGWECAGGRAAGSRTAKA